MQGGPRGSLLPLWDTRQQLMSILFFAFFGWFGLWDEFGFRDMDILYRDGDDLGETSGVGRGWGPGL